jgi:hypothetical protein
VPIDTHSDAYPRPHDDRDDEQPRSDRYPNPNFDRYPDPDPNPNPNSDRHAGWAQAARGG